VKKARELLTEIPKLPATGTPGELVNVTESQRMELEGQIAREDFFNHMADMQNSIADINGQVEKAAEKFIAECTLNLEKEKAKIPNMPEWARLGTEDKTRLAGEIDKLAVTADANLNGIQKLLNDSFYFSNEIARLIKEIQTLAREKGDEDDGDNETEVIDVTLDAPTIIQSADTLDDLIRQLEALKTSLDQGKSIKITWR
jgi:hypothetical protein